MSDIEQKAARIHADIIENWPLIHDKGLPIGGAWGLQLRIGNSTAARQMETLVRKLTPYGRQKATYDAGQRLRAAGELKQADEFYGRDLEVEWTPTVRARSRYAARNYTAAVPFLTEAVKT